MKITAEVQIDVLLSSRDTGGCYAICRITASGAARSPKYTHAWEDMYFYVLSGEVCFEVGDEEIIVEPGGSVFIPRHTPRALRCEESAQIVMISHPGGVDLFFGDLSRRRPADISIFHKHGVGL